jgi:hypothetical protein
MFNPGLLLMAYSLDSNDQMSLWDNLIDSIALSISKQAMG